MDPLTIGALFAAVTGAFMQNQAQQDAISRQQASIRSENERQRQFQRQAEQAALNRVEDYQPEKRQDRQQKIEQQVADQLIQPVQEMAPGMQEQSAVQGDVSSDYVSGRAKAQSEQMNAAAELARIMGKITGANRLRQNEAIDMLSTGQNIDMLKNFANGSMGAGRLETQAAGIPDGGMTLAGGLLQTLGSVGLAKGLGAAGKASAGTWGGTQAQALPVWSPSV